MIKTVVDDAAPWAVVGLSANTKHTAYGIGQYLRDGLGRSLVPVNRRGEGALASGGYRRRGEFPGSVQVVDCFVNSQRVGAVVDQAIAEKDRLGIEAVWLQLGVRCAQAIVRRGEDCRRLKQCLMTPGTHVIFQC